MMSSDGDLVLGGLGKTCFHSQKAWCVPCKETGYVEHGLDPRHGKTLATLPAEPRKPPGATAGGTHARKIHE